jgi:hypothetical protein
LRDERVLDWIAAFEPGHVVPGHGPLIDAAELPDVLETHRRYYVLVLDAARRGRRDGHSLLAVARRCVADIPRRGPSRTAHPLVLATDPVAGLGIIRGRTRLPRTGSVAGATGPC